MARTFRNQSALPLISAGILAVSSGSAAAADSGAIGEAGPSLAVADMPAPIARKPDPRAQIELMLLVTVNARERGILPVREAGGDFWLDRTAFAQLGIVTPPGGSGPVPLQALTGVVVRYIESEQALQLVVPPAMLASGIAHLNQAKPEAPTAETATGLVFNYDVAVNADRSGVDLGLLSTLRGFSPAGVIETTQVSQWRSGNGGGFGTIRLDTNFTRAFPDRRLSLRLGDIITSGTAWTRPTRLGGV